MRAFLARCYTYASSVRTRTLDFSMLRRSSGAVSLTIAENHSSHLRLSALADVCSFAVGDEPRQLVTMCGIRGGAKYDWGGRPTGQQFSCQSGISVAYSPSVGPVGPASPPPRRVGALCPLAHPRAGGIIFCPYIAGFRLIALTGC